MADINFSMEDFNLPSSDRAAVLKRMEETIGSTTPHFWAVCQTCDLDALKNLLHLPLACVQDIARLGAYQMVRYWGSSPAVHSRPATPKTPTPQKSTPSNSGPSPSTLPSPRKKQKISDSPTILPRDANAKKRAEERDNFRCVLTGLGITDVAHIYPHHSLRQKEEDKSGPRHTFWDHLKLFWPEKKVAAWEAKLFPQGINKIGKEEVYNLISLTPTVHAMWGQGLFALKPISEADDKKILKVQFFWQKKQEYPFPNIDFTTRPISTEGLMETTGAHGGPIWLFDKNKKIIQSGDYFELETDDPVAKPLPSFELLELQWFLQRVRGMAGAADVDGENAESNLDNEEFIFRYDNFPLLSEDSEETEDFEESEE